MLGSYTEDPSKASVGWKKRRSVAVLCIFWQSTIYSSQLHISDSVRHKTKVPDFQKPLLASPRLVSLLYWHNTDTFVWMCQIYKPTILVQKASYTYGCEYIMKRSLYAHLKCQILPFARIWQWEASPLVHLEGGGNHIGTICPKHQERHSSNEKLVTTVGIITDFRYWHIVDSSTEEPN